MTGPLEDAAALLKAFAHPLRLAIVLELRGGERCVHELVDALGASQPLVSQHLKVLRGAGVLTGRRRGRETAYAIADEHVVRIALDAVEHAAEPQLRPARPDDAPVLRAMERRAGERFRDAGLPEVADDDPPPVEVLVAHAAAGRAWVATVGSDRPAGYVIVDVLDGCAHIDQVTVDPEHQGKGLGRALIDHVEAWARAQGLPALSLTTFRDVPWNGPLYAHLGFVEVAPTDVGPELAARVREEAAAGLDPAARSCMRRPVRPDR